MQGTSLTKQERECNLYDEFDKFNYKKGESLHEYYLRFTLLLNDMNIYKMPLEQFQVNTNFLNTLPDEWSKFVTDVKLVKDLHTTNVDQLHAYPATTRRQLMQDTKLLSAAGTTRKYTPGASGSNTGKQRTVTLQLQMICSHGESFQEMAQMHSTEEHNPDNLTYDLINQSEQIMTSSEQSNDETVQNSNSSAQQDVLILSIYKEEVKDLKEMQNVKIFFRINEQMPRLYVLRQTLSETRQEKDSLMKTVSDLKKDLKMEENRNIDREIALEKKIKQLDNIIFKRGQSAQTSKSKLYDGNAILKMDTIVVPDSDETLMLCEESRSKFLLKEQDLMVVKHRVNTKPINYVVLNNDYYKRFVRQSDLYSKHAYWKATSVPILETHLIFHNHHVEVPKELPKAVEQHRLESRTFEVEMNQVLSENERLLAQAIDYDIVKTVVNLSMNDSKEFTKYRIGYIWRPTGRTFTIVGNACPLTRITTTNEVPSRKPIVLESESPKPVVKLVYSRKPRKNKNTESVSKTKVVQIVLWYLDSGCSKHMTGDRSQLTNFISKFLGTVKFGNDQVAKIMGYGDYQIGNVTISRVYYVEGLGHNLFSVGQFCDSNLEVAFRQHTCFIRNLEGVDLLTGSRGDNLYTLSLGNMMASSPICLLSKASKTKSWLWHRRLSHLNFGAINHLARHGLVRGLPKLKFEKDHLCSACALGKSSKKPHKPKSEDTNQEKLYLLHMDLCGPMRVASVNGKKYILVIVDDYSRFTWVKCLRSKDEAPAFIINFLKMIQVRLKETVRRIRTDNGTEFVNQTLREYYEKVGIFHETSVARSPQQNGVVERRNHTLIEAARTMLIYAKAPLFLWAKAVATTCYTQNRSMIRHRHGKTPYELLHDKPPDLSYQHVFGALCYPTNDSKNLGKLQPKTDIGIFIGYAPTKKAYWIYNRRTRRIIKTIHVDFDELTAMASEHSSSGPALHDMTPVTISSGLVPNPPSSTPFVPPSRSDWDLLFQPMFDKSLNPPPYVDL
ncbi:retrovirus-related pol polyprotein from transposon TNT 1-94 [Tanacetum coccineum]